MRTELTILLMCFGLISMTFPALAQSEHSLTFEGHERRYIVHVPTSATSDAKLPAIFSFHGGGGSAEGARIQTSMHETGEKHGFITIYPEGIGSKIGNFHTWNVGECCGRAGKEDINDVGFISAVIDQLARNYNIDTSRIYATGHSNGAMMSYRLGCELSDKIAAIAPNGGLRAPDTGCKTERLTPIMHFHGTKDSCVPYHGAQECGGCFQEMMGIFGKLLKNNISNCQPVPETLEKWARHNGCTDDAPQMSTHGENVTCYHWSACTAPVSLCAAKGAGHTWPGGEYGASICRDNPDGRKCSKYKSVIGEINQDISANEEMWKFFQRHSL